jgi:hypothetical protein
MQTVKIFVNYAVIVESVKHENPAFAGEIFGPKSG